MLCFLWYNISYGGWRPNLAAFECASCVKMQGPCRRSIRLFSYGVWVFLQVEPRRNLRGIPVISLQSSGLNIFSETCSLIVLFPVTRPLLRWTLWTTTDTNGPDDSGGSVLKSATSFPRWFTAFILAAIHPNLLTLWSFFLWWDWQFPSQVQHECWWKNP